MRTRLLAGLLALALVSIPARAANDAFAVNGLPFIASVPGGYLPAFAAYFPNGLFSISAPAYVQGAFTILNFPATQPVSAASLPLPAGAATAANQPALNGDGGSLAHVANFPAQSAGISVNPNAGVATVANASHAANVSIGGLQTLSVFRTTAQPSGLLANIGVRFLDGQTTSSVTIYLFKALPAAVTTCSGSNTCCKDNTAFAIIAADVDNLIVPPFTITPSQYSGITGFSYGNNQFSPAMPMANADSTTTTNIYACVTVNTTYTPAANSLFLTSNMVQD